jgi:hypothetical protein
MTMQILRRLYAIAAVFGILCIAVQAQLGATTTLSSVLLRLIWIIGFSALVSAFFFFLIDVALWFRLLKAPESYKGLASTDQGIEFQLRSTYNVERVAWKDIARLTFSRSLSMDYEDESWSDWCVETHDGRHITIPSEPHSQRTLFFACRKHLHGFNLRLAIRANLSAKRLTWILYESTIAGPVHLETRV